MPFVIPEEVVVEAAPRLLHPSGSSHPFFKLLSSRYFGELSQQSPLRLIHCTIGWRHNGRSNFLDAYWLD